MDKYIDSRFERVEKSLATLIDSISKYNPSVAAANELEAADRELSNGLKQVEIHQNNHLRIKSLHATISTLDTQIRDTLVSLAAARKEIKSTTATVFPTSKPAPINYDELLSFARRISKTTLPPSGTALPPGLEDLITPTITNTGANTTTANTPAETPAAMTPIGAATPQSAGPNGAPTPLQSGREANNVGSSNAVLPPQLSEHLNPHGQSIFLPWPHDEQVRLGALLANQELMGRGIELRGYDPVEVERLKVEEEERQKREAAEREERARVEADERRRIARERWEADEGKRRERERLEKEKGGGEEKAGFQFLEDDDE